MGLRFLIAALLTLNTSLAPAEQAKPVANSGLSKEEVKEGFVSLFDGKTHEGWQGDTKGYKIENGVLACAPGGNLFTKKEYGDFVFRFEVKLPPGGNNGVGIRTPLKGNPAYNAATSSRSASGTPRRSCARGATSR
jgi:hypothetical protein